MDPATKSVQVSSGLLGIFGATLEVTDETKINVQGKDGSLADIREGARVKASYESRDGKNVAKSIDVMAAEEKPQAAPRPAAPGAPAPGATPPSATQPGSQRPRPSRALPHTRAGERTRPIGAVSAALPERGNRCRYGTS